MARVYDALRDGCVIRCKLRGLFMTHNTDGYSDEGFWEKLRRYAMAAGRSVVEHALQLYYAAQAPKTPAWAKTVIYGALAYFILPVDAIPDFVPVAGYSDDLGALAAAIMAVQMYITDEVRRQAAAKLREWFGEDQDKA